MHQLKVLIWKAYKVRLRSPLSTALDICGPITIIILYLCAKYLLNSMATYTVDSVEPELRLPLFRNLNNIKKLNIKQDLRKHFCPKVPIYVNFNHDDDDDKLKIKNLLSINMEKFCSIELIFLNNNNDLIDKLFYGLKARINFKQNFKVNLTKSFLFSDDNRNDLFDGCIKIPNYNDTIYQFGLILNLNKKKFINSIEIYSTDLASNLIYHQPLVLESIFNEYTFPQSDSNSGLHLIEICLTNTYNNILNNNNNYSNLIDKNYNINNNNNNNSIRKGMKSFENLNLRFKPFPITAATHITPIFFNLFLLSSYLFNTLATVMRVSEDKECGMHNYLRLSGVSATKYWLSHLILIIIHMIIQSLLFAVLLSIPTSTILFDPFYESTITFKWLTLLTYSIALNMHVLFIGSMFERTSHAILSSTLISISYGLSPISFFLQWNPYNFSELSKFTYLQFTNPVSTYQNLLFVSYGVYLQTNEPLSLSHLKFKIIGKGVSEFTIGFLWLSLIIQGLFWFLLTILIDQFSFSSGGSLKAYLTTFKEEFFCFNSWFCCFSFYNKPIELNESEKTKSSSHNQIDQNENKSKFRDPNRMCCQIRNMFVEGPIVSLAQTKGDPLKLTPEQLNKIQAHSLSRSNNNNNNNNLNRSASAAKVAAASILNKSGSNSASASTSTIDKQQHLINSSSSSSKSAFKTTFANNNQQQQNYNSNSRHTSTILLDETVQQHIVWKDSQINLKNINLDFRFNQISFILGSTDSKELFFNSLLGLNKIKSNDCFIILDGIKYRPSNISLARKQIGYLGEKDIFVNEMNIFDNLQLFGSIRDSNYNQYDSESSFLLTLLHLSSRKLYLPTSLTSRSCRKLALAAAAVGHTKLLLLVEPTLSLRWKPRCQVLNLLKKYKSIRSIIVDTSDIDEAIAFGDRIVLFKNGLVDLDGSPSKLAKKLTCGHWLVFEPATTTTTTTSAKTPTAANQKQQSNQNNNQNHNENKNENHNMKIHQNHVIDGNNLEALEKLTNDIFKQDKIERLDSTKRSVYEELMNLKSTTSTNDGSKSINNNNINNNNNNNNEQDNNHNNIDPKFISEERLHKTTVLLKVKQSENSNRSICTILKLFAHNQVHHGFRLIQLTFESLEDIMVLKMSKANYPALPTDLLLSLIHRTSRGKSLGLINGGIVGTLEQIEEEQELLSSMEQQEHKQISVRNNDYYNKIPKVLNSLFASKAKAIIKDRLYKRSELILIFGLMLISLIIIIGTLMLVKITLNASYENYQPSLFDDNYKTRSLERNIFQSSTKKRALESSKRFDKINKEFLIDSLIDLYYKQRIGFFVIDRKENNNNNNSIIEEIYDNWKATSNKNLKGILKYSEILNESDTTIVAKLIQSNKDFPASIIFYDPQSNDLTITFEPKLVHSMMAGLRAFINFQLNFNNGNNNNNYKLDVTRHHIPQPWHRLIGGSYVRRYFYGIGFSIAEGVALSSFVIAPFRHRQESRVIKVRAIYWIIMSLIDLTISLILIVGYIIAMILIEQTTSMILILNLFIMLIIYKFVTLPIAYLASLVIDSISNGFAFILLFNITITWIFTIHLKTFVDWSLFEDKNLYLISNLLSFFNPISAIISSLRNINHVSNMNELCQQVPAYLMTKNVIDIDGYQRTDLLSVFIEVIEDCLSNGKNGISLDLWNYKHFGILWQLYMLILFGFISWSFLIFSERVFGILARKLNSVRTNQDPLNSVIRSTDGSLSHYFKWDREKDRLISEYVRSMNEPKYVQKMAINCLYIRIWLKPMSDQTNINKSTIPLIIEPLIKLGQTRNGITIELKTTLQIFIRIGNENNHCKLDKIQLIEAYLDFSKQHSDIIMKFAVFDWTRETLYKILLHGHYNTKSTSAIT